ncbi:hypothetical protein D9M72_126010 [compost metagenome]
MGGKNGVLPAGAPSARGTGIGSACGVWTGASSGAAPPLGGSGFTVVSTPSVERLLLRKSVNSSPDDRSSEATACPGGNSEK